MFKQNGLLFSLQNMSDQKPSLDQLRIDRTGSQDSSPRDWLVLAIVALILLLGFSTWWLARPKPAVVRTIAASAGAASGGSGPRTLLNASGYVTPRREATVSSKVTGKVVDVLIEEGMKVEAGQVLARIDPLNVEANLRLAEAQLQAARSSLNETKVRVEEAEREFRRMTSLAEKQIATQADLDRTEADVKSFGARLEKQMADIAVAERQAGVWKQQVEDTVIRAPFAGVVTIKNAQPGEMISPLSAGGFTRTGICTIVDMTSLEVEVDVNESFINRVTAGQQVEATLDSYPDWKIPSKVIAIIPTADRQKATVKVRVGFEKLDPRILPQMGVKVAFHASEETASTQNAGVTVPRAAVRQDGGRDIVWAVRDGRVERRAVTVGRKIGEESIITAGLSSGERVVVQGGESLKDGGKITEAKQ